ncbi:MAG: molybdenum cofactor biosynthesis protein MoaE [Acidothermus cellulolyticus]|nr:molybdenum cofactor biosynthesis protein MoaE [Acidothermus cellulolyticus]
MPDELRNVAADPGVEAPSAVVRLIGIRSAELSVDEAISAVRDPRAGGIAVFIGTVRDTDEGRGVVALDYEAHPLAEQFLQDVAGEIAGRHAVFGLAAVHRTGSLRVGDIAVVTAASAAHRDQAFAAAREFIDVLKDRVPIWKRQWFADGTSSWVGSP